MCTRFGKVPTKDNTTCGNIQWENWATKIWINSNMVRKKFRHQYLCLSLSIPLYHFIQNDTRWHAQLLEYKRAKIYEYILDATNTYFFTCKVVMLWVSWCKRKYLDAKYTGRLNKKNPKKLKSVPMKNIQYKDQRYQVWIEVSWETLLVYLRNKDALPHTHRPTTLLTT